MLAGLAGTALTGAVAAPLIGASAATGATLSAALGTYSLMAPETFAGIYAETGDLAPGASTLAGAVNTALELVTPVQVLKSFGPRMKQAVVSKLLEKSGMKRSLIASAVKGTVRGAATEGFTEGSQVLVNQNAEKFVADSPMFQGIDWERAVSNAVAGAAVGIPLGGSGS